MVFDEEGPGADEEALEESLNTGDLSEVEEATQEYLQRFGTREGYFSRAKEAAVNLVRRVRGQDASARRDAIREDIQVEADQHMPRPTHETVDFEDLDARVARTENADYLDTLRQDLRDRPYHTGPLGTLVNAVSTVYHDMMGHAERWQDRRDDLNRARIEKFMRDETIEQAYLDLFGDRVADAKAALYGALTAGAAGMTGALVLFLDRMGEGIYRTGEGIHTLADTRAQILRTRWDEGREHREEMHELRKEKTKERYEQNLRHRDERHEQWTIDKQMSRLVGKQGLLERSGAGANNKRLFQYLMVGFSPYLHNALHAGDNANDDISSTIDAILGSGRVANNGIYTILENFTGMYEGDARAILQALKHVDWQSFYDTVARDHPDFIRLRGFVGTDGIIFHDTSQSYLVDAPVALENLEQLGDHIELTVTQAEQDPGWLYTKRLYNWFNRKRVQRDLRRNTNIHTYQDASPGTLADADMVLDYIVSQTPDAEFSLDSHQNFYDVLRAAQRAVDSASSINNQVRQLTEVRGQEGYRNIDFLILEEAYAEEWPLMDNLGTLYDAAIHLPPSQEMREIPQIPQESFRKGFVKVFPEYHGGHIYVREATKQAHRLQRQRVSSDDDYGRIDYLRDRISVGLNSKNPDRLEEYLQDALDNT